MKIKNLLLISILFSIFSCNTEEIGNSKDVNPETIYTQYSITHTEGETTTFNNAQFRFAGPEGTTLVLNNPSNIQFDGQSILLDSSTYRGAFYEIEKPVETFSGAHSWLYTDINGKQYKETFVYTPPTLQTQLPAIIKVADLSMQFKNAQNGDELVINISDTSKSASHDEIKYQLSNETILIPSSIFKDFKPGPISFNFYIKRQANLMDCPKEGGTLTQTFFFKERKTILE